MLIDNIREFIKKKAEEFGAKTVNEFHNDCCFGFIHSEEDNSAGFHDFSLSIFPNEENKPWIICIGVGSEGFKNDAELAIHPGLRRLFSKLVNNRGFCNSNFSDLTTYLPETITLNKEICHLKDGIKKYNKVVHACELVDNPESEEGRKIISSFIAGYSKIRKWAKDDIHRKAVSKALEPFIDEKTDTLKEIKEVLNERKFVVILGPPGTGKTRAAKQVAKNMNAKTFF
ncbi:AAA family ATPase, partial [bacterium]|nr:AAA family ATPase [bacterium]